VPYKNKLTVQSLRISLARWRVPSLPRSTRPRRRRAV